MWMTRSRRSQTPRRGAAQPLALALLAWLACGAPARAETTILDAVDAPIIRINVRASDVTIRTWQRSAVSVEGDPALVVQRRTVHVAATQIPLFIPGAAGRRDGRVQLPPESFVVSSIPYGPREQIIVKSAPGLADAWAPAAPLTVTVPANAVFVSARTGSGNLEVHDYRAGTFVGFAGRGGVALYDSGGTAFVQTGPGPLRISDSSFDRLRARSVAGNMTFERCSVRQIEATSVTGSLVYDGGSFGPGLARFESARGNVAVSTAGAAQIAAHAAGSGKIFTNFERGARVDAREGSTTAVVGEGGPVVTATTEGGNVFLYDGSLRNRKAALPPQWQAPFGTLQRPGERALGAEALPRTAVPGPLPAATHFRRPPRPAAPSAPPKAHRADPKRTERR